CEVKCIYRNTKVKLYDFFCQAEDGIRDRNVTGVQTCALPIFSGIAKEIHLLAEKARSNQLRPEDMEDGTFTVNNTGTFGSVSSKIGRASCRERVSLSGVYVGGSVESKT